jgi:AmiR/NasT family two-component response regulator
VGALRLLVAEDEDAVRNAIVQMSESLGHQVVAQARDGPEAVDLVAQANPDLVLLDIRMPKLNGLEAAKAILASRPLPIVIVTGHTEQSLIDDAAELGVFSYLVKPLTCERLAAAIATALARFKDLESLRGEVGELKDSLDARKLVERAKGIIMRDMKVGEQEAYRWLQRTSTRSNQKLAEVARRIVALEVRATR